MASPPPATPDADPSMEEILASIRRTLNEEPPAATEPPAEQRQEDVLVLDRSMMVRDPMAESAPPHHATEAMEPVSTDPMPAQAVTSLTPVLQEAPIGGEAVTPASEAVPSDQPVLARHQSAQAQSGQTPSSQTPGATPDSTAPDHASLVAPEAAAAAAVAMGDLVRTLAADRKPQIWSQGPTLEDLVRVTLRPLLKEWLDTNLPPLVERLVRAEIERVVGRAIP